MPPARKDSPQGDDLSRPSTSRAFSPSPSIAPPVKRAKSSVGGGAPSASRRQSMGGRQARIEEFVDEKELQSGLLYAAMETADELLKENEENGREKIEIDKEVISATAKIVWDTLAEDWAADLVAFSKHAGRETIRDDDVKLIMRRNPKLLAEILAECEEEEFEEASTSTAAAKRKSTGGVQNGRAQKEAKEDDDMEIIEDFITPLRPSSVSSMTSVVPETPHGIVPLAHSTPMNGRGAAALMMARRGNHDFPIPSPIREDEEKKGEGRRVNRSIINDLSDTIKDGDETIGVNTQEMDEDFIPMVIDLRHPREQAEEEMRMREEADGNAILSQTYQLAGASPRIYSRADSTELFKDEEERKEDEYDSFDDDFVFGNDKNKTEKREEDASHRMSESAALREMLDGGDEEMGRTVVIKQKDSFDDDDSIQFVEQKKEPAKKVHPSDGSVPSSSGKNTTMVLSGLTAMSSVAPSTSTTATATGAAPGLSFSQDSFYNDDEILTDPPQASTIPLTVPAAVPIVQKSPPTVVAAVVQPVRTDDYDSFDDDDDFIDPPNRSKENIPKAIEAPAPTKTVADRWSTVEVEEFVSPATQKKNGTNRGVFAEDIFGLNDLPTTSKPAAINKPTVSTRPSQAASVHQKPSPTVTANPPTASRKPAGSQSTVKKNPLVNKDVKASTSGFSAFSFFEDESAAAATPTIKREDSDFVDTSNRQTTSSTKGTPRGRGGWRGGRGFPRKVDPNSRINQKIREQSTPVSLSPRPPNRISELMNSFEDDDFDVSEYD